jgi:hypothetical protein
MSLNSSICPVARLSYYCWHTTKTKQVMKKGIAIIAIMVTVMTVSFGSPKPSSEAVILSTKNNVVYFKVDKSFVGGVVEVYDANNNLLEGDTLPNTHTMIYFDEMPAGHYTVKVKKGDEAVEFEYNSK